jgi:hypothetical protein
MGAKRPIPLEDPRELLELAEAEAHESRLRGLVIDCLVDLLAETDAEMRDYLRFELRRLRTLERRAQRMLGTQLVVTDFDDPAVVTHWDLDRLAYQGISLDVGSESVIMRYESEREYARQAFWEGVPSSTEQFRHGSFLRP